MKEDPNRKMTRREAAKILGIGAAGMTLGGYTATAQGFAKNETLNIGLIGCGGRMRGRLINGINQVPGTKIVAVCDVYDDFLRSAHAAVGGRDRDVYQTGDHRALLERKDIDAVVVATPDHWHAPITIDAVEAGKDVYVEKPVTHKLEEGPKLIEAQKRTGRKIQVGAQQRSMPHLAVLRQKLQSGEINPGKITRIHMQWCRHTGPYRDPNYKITENQVNWKRFLGNAPQQAFDPFRMRQWRWIWDFGNGPLGDLMVHWLDVTNWLLDLPAPSQVIMSGGKYERKGSMETPDVTNCIMEYPELDMQMNYVSSWSNNLHKASVSIMGSDATIYFDRGRYEVTPQRPNSEPLAAVSESMVTGTGPVGADFYSDYDGAALHIGDWVSAIREGREPVDDVRAGVQAAAVCHYGNLSYREKRFVQV
jgi:predicted dehydrogenase